MATTPILNNSIRQSSPTESQVERENEDVKTSKRKKKDKRTKNKKKQQKLFLKSEKK